VRARHKALNPALWGLLTAVCYVIAESLGFFIVIFGLSRNLIDSKIFDDTSKSVWETSKIFSAQYAQIIKDSPLRGIAVLLFGYGGFLLVRYLIDKKHTPGKGKDGSEDPKLSETD
jgi:hypothetical protein